MFLGREREAFLIERPRQRRMRRRVAGRSYTWVEEIIQLYVPKDYRGRPFLIIPLEPDEVSKL